jgi:hypothetical protein
MRCSGTVEISETRKLTLNEVSSLRFLKGMQGAENIYLDKSSPSIYVTDLSGTLYLIDESVDGNLMISKTMNFGKLATGIIEGKDGFLYACGSKYHEKEYLSGKGGSVFKIDKELNNYETLYSGYKGINGIATDPEGHLYFTTGNLKILSPKGSLYKVPFDSLQNSYGKPIKIMDDLRSANGLYYSDFYHSLIMTETFSKVSFVNTTSNSIIPLLDKTRLVEGFDDVAVDSKGRIWVAEPVGGFIKAFDPLEKKLIRFHIEGIGVASSCRVRIDNNKEEFIYISERQVSKNNDGRGLIAIPINELFK